MTTLSLWRVVLQQWPQGRATGMVLLDFSVFLGCFLMLLSVMEHLAWMWQILSPDVLSGWYTGSSSEIHASQRCLGLGPAAATVAHSGHTQRCRHVGTSSTEPACGISRN